MSLGKLGGWGQGPKACPSEEGQGGSDKVPVSGVLDKVSRGGKSADMGQKRNL